MPKLLHTADWHLGKRLHDFWLLDQQREALERLLDVIDDERPDAVIVAGDVFDAPIPPIRALQLWEWAVDRIVGDLRTPLAVIPGNHDHAERIAMNARLARHAGLYMLSDLAACHRPVRVAGVDLFAVPFHKPPHVRALANREQEVAADAAEAPQAGLFDAPAPLGDFDYDAAMCRLLERARRERDPEVPAVLVAHAFVDGAGEEPEGEEAITVGGVGGVRPATFHGFDYVALGHIHGPRTLRAPVPVRYCGSLYPYAFDEPNAKSVTIVELPEPSTAKAAVREVPLRASRRVRVIDGLSFEQVLERGRAARAAKNAGRAVATANGSDGTGGEEPHDDPDDFILARVTDRTPIDHALARLREVHPNALLEQRAIEVQGHARQLSVDARTISVEDAFLEFYESVFDGRPSELEAEILREVLGGDEVE